MKAAIVLLATVLAITFFQTAFAHSPFICPSVTIYCDNFVVESNWEIVREDYDDIDNHLSYTADGRLSLDVGGRWDFAVASPYVEIDGTAYELSTTARLNSPGVEKSWGLVFGASEGFESYYRVMLVWLGSTNSFNLWVTRVDFHDPQNGAPRGVHLISSATVSAEPNDDNALRVKVIDQDTFEIYLNENNIGTITDAAIPARGMFGIWSATGEYPGSEPLAHYVAVTSDSATATQLVPTAVTLSGGQTAQSHGAIVGITLLLMVSVSAFAVRRRYGTL